MNRTLERRDCSQSNIVIVNDVFFLSIPACNRPRGRSLKKLEGSNEKTNLTFRRATLVERASTHSPLFLGHTTDDFDNVPILRLTITPKQHDRRRQFEFDFTRDRYVTRASPSLSRKETVGVFCFRRPTYGIHTRSMKLPRT